MKSKRSFKKVKTGFSFRSKKDLYRAIACVLALWVLFLFIWKPMVVFASGGSPLLNGGDQAQQQQQGVGAPANSFVAYNSWVQGDFNDTYKKLYGEHNIATPKGVWDNVTQGAVDQVTQWISPAQWVSQLLGGVFMLFGLLINGLLGGSVFPSHGGETLNLGHVNLTMDSVIFGRLLNGNRNGVNYVSWELNTGNVYGVLSSFVYRLFWDIAFSAFVLVLFIMLIRQLISGGDSKKRAELKDGLSHSFLVFLMLYLIPQIADICVYLRDWLLKLVYMVLSGDNNMANISYTDIFMAQWWRWPNSAVAGGTNVSSGVGGLAMGLLFFAASCAGLIFAIDYIRIAIKQTALFSFFPVFAILSLKNKKILSNWLVEFLPNIFIPVIDAVLLLLPCMLIRFANTQGLRGLYSMDAGGLLDSGELDIAIFLIVCIMIFSVIPMRKEILKLIGQAAPMGGSRGFGGVMAAGMMAVRMMGRGGSGISSGIENYGGMSAADNMAMASALEGVGTSGVTAMAASASEQAVQATNICDEVAEKVNGAGESAVASIEEGLEGAGGGFSGADIEDSGFDNLRAQNGIDAAVDYYDKDIAEDMNGYSDSVATNELSDDLSRQSRGENLDAMDGYASEIEKLKTDNDNLMSEIKYDDDLMQKSAQLDSDYEHLKSGSGLYYEGGGEIPSSRGLSPEIYDADQKYAADRKLIDEQIKARADGFNPYKGIDEDGKVIPPKAANGVNLNYGTDREYAPSVAKDNISRIKENNKGRESLIADNNKRIHELEQKRDECRRIESNYAEADRAAGGSGKKFESAKAYKDKLARDEYYRNVANYKNFDTKEFADHLTPSQKANFYRQRAQKQMEAETRARRQKAITAAGVATGAVVGGSAMLYGGEQSAMNGAMMGGMAGGLGASKASSPSATARKEELQRRSDEKINRPNTGESKVTYHKAPRPSNVVPINRGRTAPEYHRPKQTTDSATRIQDAGNNKIQQQMNKTQQELNRNADIGKELTRKNKNEDK